MTTEQQIKVLHEFIEEMNGHTKREMDSRKLFNSMHKRLECNNYHGGKHGLEFIWGFTLDDGQKIRLTFDLTYVNRFDAFVSNGRLEWE